MHTASDGVNNTSNQKQQSLVYFYLCLYFHLCLYFYLCLYFHYCGRRDARWAQVQTPPTSRPTQVFTRLVIELA